MSQKAGLGGVLWVQIGRGVFSWATAGLSGNMTIDYNQMAEKVRAGYRSITDQYRRDDEIEVTTPNHRRLGLLLRQICIVHRAVHRYRTLPEWPSAIPPLATGKRPIPVQPRKIGAILC